MSERLLRLARRIRDECGELEWLVARVQEGWHRAQRSSDDFYVDSVALNLHSFYAGLGRLFEMVAAAIDGSVPRGQNWHQMLLEQMVAEVPWVRPALMSEETRRMLDEYRGFRHVVRNVYAFRFDLAKVQKLVQGIPVVFSQVRANCWLLLTFWISKRQRMGKVTRTTCLSQR